MFNWSCLCCEVWMIRMNYLRNHWWTIVDSEVVFFVVVWPLRILFLQTREPPAAYAYHTPHYVCLNLSISIWFPHSKTFPLQGNEFYLSSNWILFHSFIGLCCIVWSSDLVLLQLFCIELLTPKLIWKFHLMKQLNLLWLVHFQVGFQPPAFPFVRYRIYS